MSGFEVVGLVLGAFPLAMIALEKYQKAAAVLGLFIHNEEELKDCMDKLDFQKLRLKINLKQLLLPLSVDYDKDKIQELLNNPGGSGWKDVDLSAKLTNRLQKDPCDLYLSNLKGMQQTMKQLNDALHAETHTSILRGPIQEASSAKGKGSRQSYRFRFKFGTGEGERNRLFDKLESYNDMLEEILSLSDKDTQLTSQYVKPKPKPTDLAICIFWKQAAKVFHAIRAGWTCPCQQHHHARLQLQHRTIRTHDFILLFEASGPAPRPWDKRRARISKGADSDVNEPSSQRSVRFLVPSTSMNTPQETSGQQESSRQIEDLCFSLRELDDDCCGYLSHDDGRYYVYAEDQESHGWQTHVTLESILKAPKSHRITRWQSFAISVILASSFVQLLDTPWLPESLSKSDIIFFQDEEQPGQFMVDRPHVTCRFVDREREARGSSRRIAVESLECLGILLLELLFRDVLEEQPCRTQFKESARALDVVAAHLWLTAVEQEAGADIQGAISWCLKGNQSMQGSPDEWRRDMLTKVIQPLQAEMKHIRPGGWVGS